MNPRQGIETKLVVRILLHKNDRRKTVNPRQGIETRCARGRQTRRAGLCRKTVNPRQGIETDLKIVR